MRDLRLVYSTQSLHVSIMLLRCAVTQCSLGRMALSTTSGDNHRCGCSIHVCQYAKLLGKTREKAETDNMLGARISQTSMMGH